jgi:hypothetical protein
MHPKQVSYLTLIFLLATPLGKTIEQNNEETTNQNLVTCENETFSTTNIK